MIRAALGSGTVPVVSQLPLYDELVDGGELGLMFPPGDAITLAGQIERLAGKASLRSEFTRRAKGVEPGLGSGRRSARGDLRPARGHAARTRAATSTVRKRISRRKQIGVDLHMHTDHSPDCATPVRTLLETARDQGLGAIAITDHNVVSGALEAREIADEVGIKVIVAEEVKTAEQGEVIGLFIEEKIERGMTMAETIAEIRRQGGLVYVPHPFDRLHSVPDYEHLLDMVDEIDILEVFNPRVTLTAFNEEAERFATKYRIVPGRRLGLARGAGARQRDDPRPRLRRARGVPGGDARRRHRPQAQEPGLCTGAQVHPDERAGAEARRLGARPDAGGRRGRRRGAHPEEPPGCARDRRRDPGEVPRARDPRAERAHPSPAGVLALPARQPDAGARAPAIRRPT